MVTFRGYRKDTKRLAYRFKLLWLSDCPQDLVREFAHDVLHHSDCSDNIYFAYAKDGKMVAREASYRGV